MTIKDMRDPYFNGNNSIDQNGYFRRNADGSIAMKEDGVTPQSKEGITATQERLTLRNKAAKRPLYRALEAKKLMGTQPASTPAKEEDPED